jgi:hypothetical protein
VEDDHPASVTFLTLFEPQGLQYTVGERRRESSSCYWLTERIDFVVQGVTSDIPHPEVIRLQKATTTPPFENSFEEQATHSRRVPPTTKFAFIRNLYAFTRIYAHSWRMPSSSFTLRSRIIRLKLGILRMYYNILSISRGCYHTVVQH